MKKALLAAILCLGLSASAQAVILYDHLGGFYDLSYETSIGGNDIYVGEFAAPDFFGDVTMPAVAFWHPDTGVLTINVLPTPEGPALPVFTMTGIWADGFLFADPTGYTEDGFLSLSPLFK
jgi:hypothetical protein